MSKKTNVIKLEIDSAFDSFEEVSEVIDVTAEDILVETKPYQEPPKANTGYAHHDHYGEAPELPQSAVPYSSSKAKTFMMLFSLSLIAITSGFVQKTQGKIDSVANERSKSSAFMYRADNEKTALAMDMMSDNTRSFEASISKMGKVIDNRKALVQVETALRKQHANNHAAFSDKEARELLLRAGYEPSKISEQHIAEFKKSYKGSDGDIDFAKDVAGDIVQEEVESFVHKMKLMSNVGRYIYNRTIE